MNQEKIGKFISERRKAKGLTQTELADKLGLNSKSISRWENGRNMPDISMLPKICEELGISLDELLQGKKIKEEDRKKSYEKTIILSLLKNKKNKKAFITIISFMFFIIILISVLILRYNYQNPNIDIDHLTFERGSKKTKEVKKIYAQGNFDIYQQKDLSLLIYDKDNNYYEFKDLLKSERFALDSLKLYLEDLVQNKKMQKYLLYDGGTSIYKNSEGTIIFCNTLDGNKDIYYGSGTLEDDLKGAFCGHKEDNSCTFTRTFYIESIHAGETEDEKQVVLKYFQGDRDLVTMYGDRILEVGKNYEFTFKTDKVFKDTIQNIFSNSLLLDIKKTDKLGLEQVQDEICVN